MTEQFKLFLSQLSQTNSTLETLTDFKKVMKNVDSISIKLNQLNYLLGKPDLNRAIKDLFEENSKTFEVLDILLAVRKKDTKKILNRDNVPQLIEDYFKSYEGVCEYIDNSGLSEVFKSNMITNLVDYVFGVEVGLDTNARKNRGGTIMENTISNLFKRGGIQFREQVNSSEFVDIESLGDDLKRFDFVVKTKDKTYLIEANYYNGGGSKLNETARSYSDIAPKINQYNNYEFVWVTDGQGWLQAKNKLEEAYSIIPLVYNLTTFKDFIELLKRNM